MDNKHFFNRKSLKPLRTYLRKKPTSAESFFNHPGRESRIVIILKSAIPATPPSKGGETYFLKPLIIIVFVNKIFPKFTAIEAGGCFLNEFLNRILNKSTK
jgi:hypothetical protein